VVAERNALKQILLNLIQNSLDAVDQEGIVEVSPDMTAAHGRRLTLRVTDNGKGMPPEVLERVFEPFYSTRASGSGLGLAICRQLSEQFGADLFLESRVSHGTTAFLNLKTTRSSVAPDERGQQENGKPFVG
jgi:signal transduction histidine kinase